MIGTNHHEATVLPTEEETEFYGMREAAKSLGLTYHDLYRDMLRGRLPVQKINGIYRIAKADLDAYREHRQSGSWPVSSSAEPEQAKDDLYAAPLPSAPHLSEVELLNKVISTVFTRLSPMQPASLTALQEVTPAIRVWLLSLQTAEGVMTCRVIFAEGSFSVEPIV
jgi:Helix-turn-helix domain